MPDRSCALLENNKMQSSSFSSLFHLNKCSTSHVSSTVIYEIIIVQKVKAAKRERPFLKIVTKHVLKTDISSICIPSFDFFMEHFFLFFLLFFFSFSFLFFSSFDFFLLFFFFHFKFFCSFFNFFDGFVRVYAASFFLSLTIFLSFFLSFFLLFWTFKFFFCFFKDFVIYLHGAFFTF